MVEGWKKGIISEVCEIRKGVQFNKIELEKTGSYPCINGGIEPSGFSEKYNRNENTITISEGGNSCGYIQLVKTKFWSGGHCYTIHNLNESKLVQNYFYHYLKGYESKVMQLRVGSGLPNIQQKALYLFEINYPTSLTEQKKIADILSTVDKAISETQLLIAKYQRIKTGLMHDLLTNGIDQKGNIRNKKTHKYVVKNGVEVPEEWEVVSVEEITELVSSGVTPLGGSNVYLNEGVMLIRSQNVLVNKLHLSDVAFISENTHLGMKRTHLKRNDVLLNITGASIGRSAVYNLEKEGNVNQHVCVIRLKNVSDANSNFIMNFLNSFYGQVQIKKYLGASNREGLNFQQIREIKVGIPSSDLEFLKIYKITTQIENQILQFTTELQKLTKLKTGLIQDLLTGKVRVKQ